MKEPPQAHDPPAFGLSIEKQGFTIDNPNAGGSCACGGSFT